MKRGYGFLAFFVATALYVACALFATPVHSAEGDFAPFQAAHGGNWFDPSQSGAGFDVLPYTHDGGDFGAFVTYYAGAPANGLPVWFATQVAWHGDAPTSGSLYLSSRAFGDSGDSGPPVKVGSITFHTDGKTCSSLAADIAFDPGSPFEGVTPQHFELVPLIQTNAGECFQCPAVDFGPNDMRCVAVGAK